MCGDVNSLVKIKRLLIRHEGPHFLTAETLSVSTMQRRSVVLQSLKLN